MSGSSNFLRFNPNEINTISDNAYSLNGQRLGGLQGGIAPSALHNKVYFQASTMTSALGQVLADQGFNVSDHDYNGLVSALSSVIGSAATAVYPSKYITGNPPVYNNTNSVILPAGLGARNKADDATLIVASDLTVNLNVNGANGLDTGTKTTGWYYLYLIGKSSDGTVSGLWSATNESSGGSIVLPAGYDQKAQLRVAWRVNGVNNLMYARVASGWPYMPTMMYNENVAVYGVTGALTVLANGVSNSWTTISCASLVPPCSNYGILSVAGANTSGLSATAQIRTTGFTHDGFTLACNPDVNNSMLLVDRFYGAFETNNLQQIDYRNENGAGRMHVAINVLGYTITGVN